MNRTRLTVLGTLSLVVLCLVLVVDIVDDAGWLKENQPPPPPPVAPVEEPAVVWHVMEHIPSDGLELGCTFIEYRDTRFVNRRVVLVCKENNAIAMAPLY
jgi:hypothetical protein